MRRRLLGFLALLLTAVPLSAAPGGRILLVARDLDERPLAGFRFACQGIESLPTSQAGATELNLPPEHRPGQQIKIFLRVPRSKRAEEWFLVNPQVNIPLETASAEVVLMRRSTFRQMAAEVREASRLAEPDPAELTAEDRKRVLVEVAAHHGLTADQLEKALRSFAETQDPRDRGIAAYLDGEFAQAEELLNPVAERKESDLVETLRYLGASQYEQAKYRAAADSFRKALALHGEDAELLGWLGEVSHQLAEWNEAELLMRRVLTIREKSLGRDHPDLAPNLNNLAALLLDTGRFDEAEPLMRRALALEEKSFGPDHPSSTTVLNCLALLLEATDRSMEAEPLMRRAIAIDEKIFGSNDPKLSIHLNNLASLLLDKNSCNEAESLMRRALAIAERSLGPDHPRVAIVLDNLGRVLQRTNRIAEAESSLRRALTINEKSFGPDHPSVAHALCALASLLMATKRIGEAEPLMRRALAIEETSRGPVHPRVASTLSSLSHLLKLTERFAEAERLMRRALAITEKSFGPFHSKVAIDLNDLARLLQAEGRLYEAEPLMRRALEIDEKNLGPVHPGVAIRLGNLARLLQARNRLAEAEALMFRAVTIFNHFKCRTGREHPMFLSTGLDYLGLLRKMGKSDTEIEPIFSTLIRPAE